MKLKDKFEEWYDSIGTVDETNYTLVEQLFYGMILTVMILGMLIFTASAVFSFPIWAIPYLIRRRIREKRKKR